GAVVGAYGVFTGAQSLYKNGASLGGVFSLGMSAFGVATGVNMAIGASMFGPIGWIVAGAVLAASFSYAGINDWITNGASLKSVLTTVVSSLALIALAGPIIGGAVILFNIFWSLFHQPDPAEV